MKIGIHPLGKRFADSRYAGEVLYPGARDLLQTAQVFQECLPFCRSDAWDFL